MKLSKVYANDSNRFGPIEFSDGLNAIIAQIRKPENRDKDTHNLGKTTFAKLLDFLLLAKRNKSQFLFKHFDNFKSFTFYLELKLNENRFLTICRPVSTPSKISFKYHQEKHQNFSHLEDGLWDHFNVSFDRARSLLDSALELSDLDPWGYRQVTGYLLRTQNDYTDVFQLQKFKGKHETWKPFLAKILGFDSKLLSLQYQTEKEIAEKESSIETLTSDVGVPSLDTGKIEGLLQLKQREADKIESQLSDFDFREKDAKLSEIEITNLDLEISELNEQRYFLNQSKNKIESSIQENSISFNVDEAETLFQEVGIFFKNQIKKDFEQLVDFNKSITEERKKYLSEELEEINSELNDIRKKINTLSTERVKSLNFIKEVDIFEKYKSISNELITLKSDIETLERQKENLNIIQQLKIDLRKIDRKLTQVEEAIEANIYSINSSSESVFSETRAYFSDIVEKVLSRKALLSASINNNGHVEFSAEILDDRGNSTSADLGHTYKKLLCVAFDLAVLRVHLNGKFPRWLYHDGLFESLDNRKKENLLEVIREYANLGLQIIVTAIDSDLPSRSSGDSPVFEPQQIVLELHDEDHSGRLFRMPSW